MNVLKREEGYTLLEIVIAMIVFGILGTIAVAIMANQTETFNQVLNQTVGLSDSRKAIRMIRRDIQNLEVANINTMETQQFGFTDNSGANVIYKKSGYLLTRNEDVILNGLTEDPFTYLNIDQQVTAVEDSVKFISVNLNIVRNKESVVVKEVIYARN